MNKIPFLLTVAPPTNDGGSAGESDLPELKQVKTQLGRRENGEQFLQSGLPTESGRKKRREWPPSRRENGHPSRGGEFCVGGERLEAGGRRCCFYTGA